jgi:hypothetical protein
MSASCPTPLSLADLPLTVEQGVPTSAQDVAAVKAGLSRVGDRLPDMVSATSSCAPVVCPCVAACSHATWLCHLFFVLLILWHCQLLLNSDSPVTYILTSILCVCVLVQAYAAWLGFYNSAKGMGWSKPELVQQANRFSGGRLGGAFVGSMTKCASIACVSCWCATCCAMLCLICQAVTCVCWWLVSICSAPHPCALYAVQR